MLFFDLPPDMLFAQVIAAGALTRDLAIDAAIPQSLRQGYMTAVLTPLETGALLNERRAPQVLAYRNSITESSYYQASSGDSTARRPA